MRKELKQEPLAYQRLIDFNRENPDSKEIYKLVQKWHLANNLNDGVFCPLIVVSQAPQVATQLQISLMDAEHHNIDLSSSIKVMRKVTDAHIFGTWRNTLSIYEIDDDIYQQIKKSPVPLETPIDIFDRIPEWCVYIKLPESADLQVTTDRKEKTIVDGFWVLFDYKKMSNKERLRRMCINFNAREGLATLPPLTIDVDEISTLQEAIENYVNDKQHLMSSSEKKVYNYDAQLSIELYNYKDYIQEIFSLLLWLCAEEPDITNIKGEPVTSKDIRKPKYGRNKKTGAFVPPSQPSVYHVGRRLGGEVRQFKERNSAEINRKSSRKRPHIRRGHWHGVWKGTGQDRRFSVYWQPAVFVNGR